MDAIPEDLLSNIREKKNTLIKSCYIVRELNSLIRNLDL